MRMSAARREVLSNGIRLVTERMPAFHSVTIGILIERGSRHDPPGKKGMAHFVEHILVRKGQQLLAALDARGGWFEAYTERECTVYYIRVTEPYLEQAFETLTKLITERQISEEDCEQEKGIVLNEIDLYREDYAQIGQQALIEKMWQGHPLGTPILGSVETVKSFQAADVLAFLVRNYVPSRMVISIVGGNTSHPLIKQRISSSFPGPISIEAPDEEMKIPVERYGHIHIKNNSNTDLVYYSLGINSLDRMHPSRVVLFALSSLLGEGLNSRLFKKLRTEGGHTYDVQSSYQLFREGGIFAISGMSNEQTFSRVMQGIDAELTSVTKTPVADDEMAMVKSRLKANLLFNLENPELRMIRLLKLENWFQRTFSLEQELEMIEDVSTGKIMNLAASLLSNRVNLCTVGSSDCVSTASCGLLQQ